MSKYNKLYEFKGQHEEYPLTLREVQTFIHQTDDLRTSVFYAKAGPDREDTGPVFSTAQYREMLSSRQSCRMASDQS